MKILYITTIGKTMGFFSSIVSELQKDGNTVDIATNEINSPVPAVFAELGCKKYALTTSRNPFNRGNISAIKQIRKIARAYDIIHCHTPIAGVLTRIACIPLRKRGVKVMYTAHGFHFYRGAPLLNWLLYYPVEKICSLWTDVLITINDEDFDVAKKRFKAKRTVYVPGVGVDTKKFCGVLADKEKIRMELGIPQDALLLLSVGELNKNKNHQIVIRAIAKCDDKSIHYMIAGKGKEKENLERLSKKLNINDQIHFLGYRNDVAILNKVADVEVLPSIREGFSLAAIEGMAGGLPLICSDNRGTRVYAVDGVNALVCRSIDDYINAIKSMDKEKREIFGKRAIATAAEFDIVRINTEMKKIYKETMNEQ